ncbi:hypothetical protein H2248_000634 [Termitomyces sp. 'cryptogamus']|nr:hypothetical protein H2248_000634 [Termitomyces sp. 'cryptogamus']
MEQRVVDNQLGHPLINSIVRRSGGYQAPFGLGYKSPKWGWVRRPVCPHEAKVPITGQEQGGANNEQNDDDKEEEKYLGIVCRGAVGGTQAADDLDMKWRK